MASAPVTQAAITRIVKAVEAAGVPVGRIEVAPDGTVIVIPSINLAPPPKKNDWD